MTYINQSLKVLRHADRIATLQAGRIPFPINMEIDISNRCPLGCGGCHFGYTHSKGPLREHPLELQQVSADGLEDTGDLMELGLFQRVCRELAEAGVKSITFTGGGEPLVHPQFAEFLATARKHLEVGLYSSMAGSSPSKIEAIRRHCTWIVVSIDEPDRESYQAWKGTNAFQGIYRATKELTRDGSGLVTGASFLIHAGNWEKLEQMYALHKELGTTYCLFRPLVKYDLQHPDRMVEDPKTWMNQPRWRDGLITRLYQMREQYKDVEIAIDKFARYALWQRTYRECVAASLSGVVTPNGKVWACVNRRGFPGSCIGDLSKEPFVEVWQRQRRWADFDQCRVLCRGDEVNVALQPLLAKQPHENFL